VSGMWCVIREPRAFPNPPQYSCASALRKEQAYAGVCERHGSKTSVSRYRREAGSHAFQTAEQVGNEYEVASDRQESKSGRRSDALESERHSTGQKTAVA